MAADRVISSEQQVEKIWDGARIEVERKLAFLVKELTESRADETQRSRTIGALRSVRNTLRRLARRQLHPDCSDVMGADAFSILEHNTGEVARQLREFEERYAEGKRQTASAILDRANDERFREAIAWQNAHALHSAVARLARSETTVSSNRSSRRREDLVASYLQRYCTKNDTIGFFGPVGWATITRQVAALEVTSKVQSLAARHVYFEEWPMQALAQRLSGDARYRPWFVPRMLPFLRVEGTLLYPPLSRATELNRVEAAVLKECDGSRTSREIANQVMADPTSGVRAEIEVHETLERLQQRRRISWGIEAPVTGAHPESLLRRQLERIGDDSLRKEALASLDVLEGARARVASAAGKAAELCEALANLNEAFERVSGTASLRRHGETYGARTLVYQDCRRDLQMEISEKLLIELCEPLTLVLDSARWFAREVAGRYEAALAKVVARVRERFPSNLADGSVDMPSFWLHAQSLFYGNEALATTDLEAQLCARWESILGFKDTDRRVHLRSRELKGRVQSLFHAGSSGWSGARYHSPDLMLVASSLAELRKGNVACVLGELHAGLNTMLASALVNQHPDPDALLRHVKQDLGRPRLMTFLSREGTQQTARTELVADPAFDVRIILSHGISLHGPDNVLTSGELVAGQAGDKLFVRTRDGRQEFGLLEFFGHMLSPIIARKFRLLQQRPHIPRITVDKMVIQRETWQVPCSELSFAFETAEEKRFMGTRRWIAEHAIPRFVFVKFPQEQKPIYIDFSSPIYVRLFCKHVCNTKEAVATDDVTVRMSEMLPAHEDLWLSDEHGKRYTSELRTVFVHGVN